MILNLFANLSKVDLPYLLSYVETDYNSLLLLFFMYKLDIYVNRPMLYPIIMRVILFSSMILI